MARRLTRDAMYFCGMGFGIVIAGDWLMQALGLVIALICLLCGNERKTDAR